MRSRGRALILAFGLIGTSCVTPTALPSALTTGATPTPPPTSPATTQPSCAERIQAVLTFEQRVGQLFLLGLAGDRLGEAERDAIRTSHFGSVWFVEQTVAGVSGIRAVADSVQALVSPQTTGNVGFFVAANQEGGTIQSLKGPGFAPIPSAVEQAGLDPTMLRQLAGEWGRELSAAGVNLNFAPVLDVVPSGTDAQNEPIGVLKRGYGHDSATVSAHGVAFLRGMQDAGIVATAKHFPGLGRVHGNTNVTAAVVDDLTTIDDPSLAPFGEAVGAGVPLIMVSLATYTKIDGQHQAVFSPAILHQMLRGRLGFGGAIVSDDLGATAAVAAVPAGQRAIDFLSAGGDLVVSKTIGPAQAMTAAILARAAGDVTFRARVDDAALRVLRAKQSSGLLRCT